MFLREESGKHEIDLSEDDIAFVRYIVCRYDLLTIGAPSSPLLTNAMMFDYDASLSSWCVERGLIFTRYADDLFVSSFEFVHHHMALSEIVKCASVYRYSRLRINQKKTAFLSRRYRRSITGIVVTPTHSLSVGRNRKSRLNRRVYEYQQGRLAREEWSRVGGMLAFVRDVEPTFYLTLVRRYGETTIKILNLGIGMLRP